MKRVPEQKYPHLNIISVLFFATVIIAGCESKKTTPPPEPTPSVNATKLFIPSTIFIRSTASPVPSTPIPIPTPTVADADVEDAAGLIVLAMADGVYQHLFVFHPLYLPLTRLTADAWDYDHPAISPDGTSIAFCANEFGRWDIFVLNLVTGEKIRVTQTDSYACAPSWSPDGQWLAYETLVNGNLAIFLQSFGDLNSEPIHLTDGIGNNFSPAWSPGGREIAFVTDRNSRQEIWFANLDAVNDRLSALVYAEGADFSFPSWSPDGAALAWMKKYDVIYVEKMNVAGGDSSIVTLGSGSKPIWITGNNGIAAILETPNGNDLVTYRDDPNRLLYPPVHFSGKVTALAWKPGEFVKILYQYLATQSLPEAGSLVFDGNTTPDTSTGLFDLKALENVDVPHAYLSDTVDENFSVMRTGLEGKLGWDFLGSLENAYLPLPSGSQSDIKDNWLYTGRAIATNMDPFDAGWMVISREDYNGRTYWRVWLKCKSQDGSCGTPMEEPTWDFSARFNGDNTTFENGGASSSIPAGFWIDFTGFALKYGWERLPAMSNWRGYFPASLINLFVKQNGLTWREAMAELYPVETVDGLLK